MQRHAEIQKWTNETDRLRRDLENMRSRQNEMATEHEAGLKREKMIIQDLNAKVSSIEVDRVCWQGRGWERGGRYFGANGYAMFGVKGVASVG